MLTYSRYGKANLARWARDRGIAVHSASGTTREPTKKDYVTALKQADADRRFRILDLPPELRVMVYRELLMFKNSFICQTRVLRASKQIHQEAADILYRDNLIEVRIRNDGVFAHGQHCGTYAPALRGNARDAKSLIWPDFLLRAYFLRVEVVSMETWHPTRLRLPRLSTLHNILHSLCCFLQGNSKLRSLELDLRWLTARFTSLGALPVLLENAKTAVYPLRLLNHLKDLRILRIPFETAELLAPTPGSIKLSSHMVSGCLYTIAKQLRSSVSAAYLLRKLPVTHPQDLDIRRFFAASIGTIKTTSSFVCNIGSGDAGLIQAFFQQMDYLRVCWDAENPLRPGDVETKKMAETLLVLDIEQRLRKRSNTSSCNWERNIDRADSFRAVEHEAVVFSLVYLQTEGLTVPYKLFGSYEPRLLRLWLREA
ncbi:hypothetical protein LTR37_016636 [Vermiconidia calcicola]|uniref:Uncharacterized protein n=1 Tax=Vermiconidia calcicola TaxID=1690605 RepID=A0ACC3MMM8_9PEZI|nr:hypothetical protein LTR37_016636 [Vermiconidia calcicola]